MSNLFFRGGLLRRAAQIQDRVHYDLGVHHVDPSAPVQVIRGRCDAQGFVNNTLRVEYCGDPVLVDIAFRIRGTHQRQRGGIICGLGVRGAGRNRGSRWEVADGVDRRCDGSGSRGPARQSADIAGDGVAGCAAGSLRDRNGIHGQGGWKGLGERDVSGTGRTVISHRSKISKRCARAGV